MIARHNGAVVLVAGAIPGEKVEATVEKLQRGTVWAGTRRVLEPSPDRIEPHGDWSCGGSVFAHIRYERQLALKRDIIRDGFARIGRMQTPDDLPITGSQIDGYRMRARLHRQRGRIGFFREGTHELCDAGPTRQLLPQTVEVLKCLELAIGHVPQAEVTAVEVSENCPATERAIHLELAPCADPSRVGALPVVAGVTGVSSGALHGHRSTVLSGSPLVADMISVPAASGPYTVSVTRHAHSFFQGNRFLVADLMAAVVDVVPVGRVLDLYAGVGLFAVAVTARGVGNVIAIEGDRRSADDLERNAADAGDTITARHQSVETFLAVEPPSSIATVIVDPPRRGMSRDALRGTIALGAPRLVYVSCDIATLARDARFLIDAGFRLTNVRAFDLFPNTAHVESVAVFDR